MRKLLTLAMVVLVLLAATNIQSAARDKICTCVHKTTGKMRMVDDANQCKRTETFVCWDKLKSLLVLPKIWVGTNSDLNNHEITFTPQTVTEITINKLSDSSVLKMAFSGGRISFICDANDVNLNSQVVFHIAVDDVVVAESLDYDCCVAFRNQYPFVSTVIEGVSAGEHIVSVAVYKSDNQGEGGQATYTTTIGNDPNTYDADLTVEEWPIR